MDQLLLHDFIENSYRLVLWPEVQELMEYPWFRQECCLYNAFDDQPYLSSAYFVPIKRLIGINPEMAEAFSRSSENNAVALPI